MQCNLISHLPPYIHSLVRSVYLCDLIFSSFLLLIRVDLLSTNMFARYKLSSKEHFVFHCLALLSVTPPTHSTFSKVDKDSLARQRLSMNQKPVGMNS